MAHTYPARSKASLSKQLANFTNSTAGLDLTLRLVHALVLIGAELNLDNATVTKCAIAASQLALARRYLRFFCFLDFFQNVQDLLAGGSAAGTMMMMLEVVESSCLGLYFLLEDLTMLHDMNIYLVSWYMPVLLEANKFWFYAICISIARTSKELVLGSAGPSTTSGTSGTDEKKQEKTKEVAPAKPAPSTLSLLNRIVIDSLDLTLPGSFLGWIPLETLGIGMAMLVSTVLVWPTAWAKAQQ
ncbi:hypothetical protein N7474_004892 [Penicillium riverlandense]|uniref:uncharacterized protein n=1 Tax=Penicillium riverlandense TaxID=1903569 RepID=UPI002548C036|nr:uncharacterized protein N7474_004892 [Penicillium riverlandense]KAJ5819301.1 hypothetical protein N7474_004892 [Penicillium riverlandense]